MCLSAWVSWSTIFFVVWRNFWSFWSWLLTNPLTLPQISTSALRAVPLLPLPTDDGPGQPAHLPPADVGAQHPLPSSRLQAGVPGPALWAPGHDGGAAPPWVSRRHDDQTGAEGLHLWLRWEMVWCATFCLSLMLPELYHLSRRGMCLLSLPIIRAGVLLGPGVCAVDHFL